MSRDIKKERKVFWNERSKLGIEAGSNDLILKNLEIKNICKLLRESKKVLDAGCGNGYTAIELLKINSELEVFGFDYAEGMIHEAKINRKNECLENRLILQTGDLFSPPFQEESFDTAYTERSLINLNGIEEQIDAINKLADLVRPDGHIILCESFLDGLDEINIFRESIGLGLIEMPWHNSYFRLEELKKLLPRNIKVLDIINFSSSYYFLSRVINAWVSKNNNKEPEYDSELNKLAFLMPEIGICAQTKIIVLQKN